MDPGDAEAVEDGAPALVAYVDENGQPSLSIRGSTQVFSDNQIAVWVRSTSRMFSSSSTTRTRRTVKKMLAPNPQPRKVCIRGQTGKSGLQRRPAARIPA